MKFGVQIQVFENSSQTIMQNSRGISWHFLCSQLQMGYDYEIWSANTDLGDQFSKYIAKLYFNKFL